MPDTGCRIRFFHIRALTVGMMKNGEISSTRTMPRPEKSPASSKAAISTPNTTLMASTLPTRISVFMAPGRKPASVTKKLKFSSPTKASSPG